MSSSLAFAADDVETIESVTIIGSVEDLRKLPGSVFNDGIAEAKKMEIENKLKSEQSMQDLTKGATVTESGLAYKVINKGTGTTHPTANNTVTVHYTGKLTNGTIFDSSVQRGEPATFLCESSYSRLDRSSSIWT